MEDQYDPYFQPHLAIPFRREYTPFQLPLTGAGYLAGTFPNGLTTIEGSPTPATVRILLRTGKGHPGDGSLVKELQSNQDGTWIVEGLNPNLKYDVVGRLKDFNDVIMANVSPVVADEIRWVGNLEWDGEKVAGMLRFTGGVGPYSITSVSGLPAGLTPELMGVELTIVGEPTEWGEFTGVIGVKDSGSLSADVVVRLSLERRFPTVIGEFFDGGYYVGNVVVADGGEDDGEYAILMAGLGHSEISARYQLMGIASPVEGATSRTNGKANSEALLVATSSHFSYAPRRVDDLVIHGFDDWYIPSIAELAAAIAANQSVDGLNLFTSVSSVWSSTMEGDLGVGQYTAGTMAEYTYTPTYADYIRPVRRIKIS